MIGLLLFVQLAVHFDPSVARLLQDIFFDPQTSGGLLICIGENEADTFLEDLREKGITDAAMIGEVMSDPVEKIIVA